MVHFYKDLYSKKDMKHDLSRMARLYAIRIDIYICDRVAMLSIYGVDLKKAKIGKIKILDS
jgi:hypothetical protein